MGNKKVYVFLIFLSLILIGITIYHPQLKSQGRVISPDQHPVSFYMNVSIPIFILVYSIISLFKKR